MKKTLIIAFALLGLAAKAQSVTEKIDTRLQNVSQPFQFATIYGEEFAELIVYGAVEDPEAIRVGEYEISGGDVKLVYYSDKYKFVVHLRENPDSLDFTRIYAVE